jgi:hypothetical protein
MTEVQQKDVMWRRCCHRDLIKISLRLMISTGFFIEYMRILDDSLSSLTYKMVDGDRWFGKNRIKCCDTWKRLKIR